MQEETYGVFVLSPHLTTATSDVSKQDVGRLHQAAGKSHPPS